MDKLPIWLTVLLFLYGAVMLSYAVYEGRCVDLWPPKIGAICIPDPEPKETERWYGHFIDLDDKTGKPTIYDEELIINIDSTGQMSAKVEAMQGGRKKSWTYRGFKVGEYLVSSYKADHNKTGAGVLFLEEKDNTLMGNWTGRTCNNKMVVTCPYVLSKVDGIPLNALDQKLFEAGCKIYKPKTMFLGEVPANLTCE
ncbi:MAG: hypothetical protein NTV00_00825 [Methylococcales bacterium]|nr:hypothetical protein [Methylococcales bacterium]